MINPQRPAIIPVDLENNLVVTSYMDRKRKNSKGVTEILRVGIFAELSEKGEDGKFILPIDPQSYTLDKFQLQEHYQGLLGKSSHFSETLNTTLDSFLGLYFKNNDLAAFGERFLNLAKLDYMKARDLLSEVLKKDNKFIQIEEINTPEKLKHFTKTFWNFITDRNIFTHGLLYLRYPDFVPVIQYENNAKKTEYAELNEQIFSEYLETYSYLNDILTKIYDLEVSSRYEPN